MIGFIIWIIGVVLCVKAVLEIMKWPVDGVKKLLVAIIILLTSWIGICVYYFWGRENLPQILKSSSIIYRSKQTCIKNKGDRQQLSPSFQKLGRTLPKLFLIAFREIGR